MPKRKHVEESEDEMVISPKKQAKDITSDETEQPASSKKKKQKKSKKQESDSDVCKEKSEDLADLAAQYLKQSKDKNEGKRKKSEDKEFKQDAGEESAEESANKSTPKNTAQIKKGLQSKLGFSLFVGQIPQHVKKEEIEQFFSETGGVKEVRLLVYPDSLRSRGCAYVDFVDKKHRKQAFKLKDKKLGGGTIRIEHPYQGWKKRNPNPKDKNWSGKKDS